MSTESSTSWDKQMQAAADAFQRNQIAEAERLFREALAHAESIQPPDYRLTVTLANLATALHADGKIDDAEPKYLRAIAMYDSTEDPAPLNLNWLRNTLLNLGELYESQGQNASAQAVYQRVLEIDEKTCHFMVLAMLDRLSNLLDKQRKSSQIVTMFEDSLRRTEKESGPDHPNVAVSMSHLAACYAHQGRVSDAQDLWKRALAIGEKALETQDRTSSPYLTNNDLIVTPLLNLARTYSTEGDFEAAEPLFKRLLSIADEGYYPLIERVVEHYSEMLYRMNRLSEATQMSLKYSRGPF